MNFPMVLIASLKNFPTLGIESDLPAASPPLAISLSNFEAAFPGSLTPIFAVAAVPALMASPSPRLKVAVARESK